MHSNSSLFDEHFAALYQARWPELRAALAAPAVRTERSCFDGHAQYVLDRASVTAAEMLGVQPGHEVLDMCAAPGGKALILLEALCSGEGAAAGSLVANELSLARRKRLEEVMRTHVPESHRGRYKITGFDGNLFGLKRENSFDRVLLDAPCSSERHLLEDDAEMKEWKLSRTKQLAQRQYSLICSAVLALKPGGILVYSTCSISPLENDGVVGRLLARKAESVEVDPDVDASDPNLRGSERTSFGFQIFPDIAQGAGPIYMSRLRKKK